ncbi:hypothetical protein ACWEQ7_05630 [Streptomyces sp. NPDC004069]
MGKGATEGPNQTADGQNGLLTVPQASTTDAWADEVDIRPTLLRLAGLQDSYLSDGAVLTGIMRNPPHPPSPKQFDQLVAAYRQLNSSVGAFATDTLIADTAALADGSSADDSTFTKTQSTLTRLADERDALAQEIKVALNEAYTDNGRPKPKDVSDLLQRSVTLLQQAHTPAAGA